ncbi:Sds3-like-domain-containing protein [Zopfochytrium polystomum]|nr:Sds3-like-domain-containing protein [Zopfochytrium polystomum]
MEVHLTKKEKRHREFSERLEKVGRDFADNRERVYLDKLAKFQDEIREIQEGVHVEFQDRLRELEIERDAAIAKARLFLEYRLSCARETFKLEKAGSDEEYEAEKTALFDRINAAIEDRRKRLKEDRENMDIPDPTLTSTVRKITRSNAARAPESKDKKRPKHPQLHPLKEHEIMEDLTWLRKRR